MNHVAVRLSRFLELELMADTGSEQKTLGVRLDRVQAGNLANALLAYSGTSVKSATRGETFLTAGQSLEQPLATKASPVPLLQGSVSIPSHFRTSKA
ncbi:hypothetical protein HQN59_17715 [Schlegelella sp. ID0723]|uniref:Uncharacterized protein n=2 Tax=Piscinibacter koreensis TaxID=2742824 RepID=A0A7Y6TXZ8_9BURK|nr:hypothetical protein [Schlegelella koreensis]